MSCCPALHNNATAGRRGDARQLQVLLEEPDDALVLLDADGQLSRRAALVGEDQQLVRLAGAGAGQRVVAGPRHRSQERLRSVTTSPKFHHT